MRNPVTATVALSTATPNWTPPTYPLPLLSGELRFTDDGWLEYGSYIKPRSLGKTEAQPRLRGVDRPVRYLDDAAWMGRELVHLPGERRCGKTAMTKLLNQSAHGDIFPAAYHQSLINQACYGGRPFATLAAFFESMITWQCTAILASDGA